MPTATIVELPKIYENMTEATLGKWAVSVGADVTKDSLLVELITEKTVEELQAPVSGKLLAIYADSKSTVPAGYALCAIGIPGDLIPDVTASNAAKLNAAKAEASLGLDLSGLAPTAPVSTPAFKAAPAAKAFARQQHVELTDVAAFCGRNTIHRQDVENFIKSKMPPAPTPTPSPAQSAVPVCPTGRRAALVTGATGAIGSEIARRLGADGFAVALHYNSREQEAQALCAELSSRGIPCACFKSQLASDSQACAQLIQSVTDYFGHIDVLVNCAGILQDATIPFMSDDTWNKVLEMDLTIPFRLMRAVTMAMGRRRWGRIINLSSEAGRMGSANRANYAAAKEGLVGLTRSAALEFAALGIRVNAVSPGFVESPMTAAISEAKCKELMRQIPAHRFAKPSEVAALVAFLCSDDADYITGQVIAINGGLAM